MTNPVVTFLTTRNGYTFEEGVAVFAMYTRDRFAVERVSRSRDIRLLNQELKKLAHIPGLKPVNGAFAPAVPKETITENTLTPEEPAPVVPETEESDPMVELEIIEAELTVKDNVTFAQLQHYKFTRYEDMPTPETQQLWQRNNDRWHRKIDLFAKMKMLAEGDELKTVRNELIAVSREHREGWKLIDQKCHEFVEQQDIFKTEPEKPDFNISTYRTYICEKANLETLTDKQFLEVQRRVDAMTKAGIAISEETLKKLRAKGIQC